MEALLGKVTYKKRSGQTILVWHPQLGLLFLCRYLGDFILTPAHLVWEAGCVDTVLHFNYEKKKKKSLK